MEFGLKKTFDIDHGELDGIPPHQCFVLGYELALIDERLNSPDEFACYVHAENRERVEKSCRDAERDFTLNYMDNDVSESWMWLKVAAFGRAA